MRSVRHGRPVRRVISRSNRLLLRFRSLLALLLLLGDRLRFPRGLLFRLAGGLFAFVAQFRLGFHAAQPIPCQVHDVRGELLLAELALVGPILAGVHGHADEHLRVIRHAFGRQMLAFERVGENVLNAYGDVSKQRIERVGRVGFRRIAREHAEAFGVFLHVGEQRKRGAFHDLARMRLRVGQRVDENVGERAHFAVHHHGVQAFLSSEMFVDDGFRHFCGRGDLFHAHCFESLGREQRSTDFDELFAPLVRRHSGCIGHTAQFFTSRG